MDIFSTARARIGALFAAEVDKEPGGGPPLMQCHAPSEHYGALDGKLAFCSADEGGTMPNSTGAAGARYIKATVPIAGPQP